MGGLSSPRNMIPPSAPGRPPSPRGWGCSSASCLFPVRPAPTPLLFHARPSVLIPRTPPWAPPPPPGEPLVTLRPSGIKKGRGPGLAQAWPSPRELPALKLDGSHAKEELFMVLTDTSRPPASGLTRLLSCLSGPRTLRESPPAEGGWFAALGPSRRQSALGIITSLRLTS